VIECFNPIGYLDCPPKKFLHNWMNLNHIGHAHTIPAVTVLHVLLTLLHSFKYICTSSKLQITHIVGTLRFDFPHKVKAWFF